MKGKPAGITVYNPDALKSDIIYIIAEGEKDVDTLTRLRKPAVCGPNGAGHNKWPKEANKLFEGKYVVTLGDNDKVGRDFAIETATNLHGIAKDVKLVDLADIWTEIPEKADITDYIEKFGDDSIVKVDAHADQLPNFDPQAVPDARTEFLELFKQLDDYTEEEATWLVTGWIPEGQITLLDADGGVGKTTTWCNLIAAVSKSSYPACAGSVNTRGANTRQATGSPTASA